MSGTGVRRVLLALFLFLAGCGGAARIGARTEVAPVPAALGDTAVPEDTAIAQRHSGTATSAAGSSSLDSGKDAALAVQAALSRSPYDRSRRVLLKMEYAATASAPRRPPLNIALVLDRSGSMAEKRKLPYTLEAARGVVENMTDRDVLSIVAFNHQVTVLSGAGRVVNKPFLFHRLEELSAGGYTDVSAGLLEGIAQVESQRADGQVRHVLLLTDGLANRGVTDPRALGKIVAKAAARKIGVSTLGVGTDFDERLLADLAAAGGGRYHYAKSAEEIPMAFQDELAGLLEVVAQNTRVELIAKEGRISKIYGQTLDQSARAYTFPIGNVRAAERGFVLVELDPGPGIDAEIRLTFDDPQRGERVTQRTSLTTSGKRDELREDPDVLLYRDVLAALEQAEVALQGFDVQRYQRTRAAFDQLYERARQRATQNRDQELLNQAFVLKHFTEELAATEQQGLLHGHSEARERLQKESHYLRYLLTHHRPAQLPEDQ